MSRKSQLSETPFVALLEQRAPRPLSIQEMVDMLSLEHYDRKAIRAVLEAQVAKRTLRRIGKTRYQWVREPAPVRSVAGKRRASSGGARIEGLYCRVRAGYGFVEVLGRGAERFARDILIPEGQQGEALHGDRVTVEVLRRDPRARRFTGRIIAVTDHVHERIIGTLELRRDRWWLLPQDELLPPVEIVAGTEPRREQAGKIGLVRLTRAPSPTRGPGGEVDEVLGDADDPRVQFLTIAFEHNLRTDFPPETLAEAAALPADPPEAEVAGREDLRALPFVTIDGETARDFDDAVCLEPAPNGGYRLWVAIADVSRYVSPGSALDTEARRRGTSVYFPDRAIPMLPEALSSGLCSLNPDRNRLVLVAEMHYDAAGHRQAARFARGVIRSRARLTYTQVAAVLSTTQTPEIAAWRESLGDLIPQLRLMRELMHTLFRNRVKAGSLDLDLPDALVDLSEEGRSIGVRLAPRNDAHRLIEEFMLEANRAVAGFLREQDVPFPYRIHEPPDPADIDELNQFLRVFGLGVQYDQTVRPPDIQRVLRALEGHRLSRVLSRVLLRSLKQAQYTTANAGHFGLAFPIYCHFTSPIRRYPDLLVHRQLGQVFDGQVSEARGAADALEADSIRSSQAERQAMQAERAMLDLKKAEFMLGHLLEPEPATITSVLAFGVFVELDAYPIEGLVRVDGLGNEGFTLIEAERSLRGLRTGQRFRLGDRVLVEATNVSLRERKIDCALLERLAPALDERRPERPRRARPAPRRKKERRPRR